jgi:hypothetical protein
VLVFGAETSETDGHRGTIQSGGTNIGSPNKVSTEDPTMHKSTGAFIVAVSLLAGSMSSAVASAATMVYDNAWKATKAYVAGNVVRYGSYTYVALTANKNVAPSSSTTDWAVLANLPTAPAVGGGTYFVGGYNGTPISNLGSYPGTVIAQIPIAVSGEYAINATAFTDADPSDFGVFCYVSFGARGPVSDGNYGGASNQSGVGFYNSAAVNDYWVIDAGDSAQLYCYSYSGDPSSIVYSAGMTAMLINDPAKSGVDADALRGSINDRPEVVPHFRSR